MLALGLVLAFGAGQQAWAAQQQEDDSVYRWGRWAVLSPAAGGDSYEGSETPDAANNARPSDASAFQPEIASVGVPPAQPTQPPVLVPNPPGNPPPSGDPRGTPPPIISPIVVPNPPVTAPPSGDPRGTPPPILVNN
jgi:hypothetical protein